MKKRKFIAGVFNHTYQRTVSGFNIFYDMEDYVVYYTIFSILAAKYNITVYGLCLMIDHIHSLIACREMSVLSRFMSHVTNVFVKEYNVVHGRVGPLFCEGFGSAPKQGMKLLRTAVAYLYNNPVERYLCRCAQDYRWNFLAYCSSVNPFSDRLIIRNASYDLRDAIKEVQGSKKRGRHITYIQLKRMMAPLDCREKNQLIDYIISTYSVIRFDILSTECYSGYDNMLVAINSNAGSEYDIEELKHGRSDVAYRELYQYVRSRGFINAGSVISLGMDSKSSLMMEMMRYTSASRYQICKYLHLKLIK